MKPIAVLLVACLSIACDVTQTGPTIILKDTPQATPSEAQPFDPCWLYVGAKRELCEASKPKF